MSASPTPTTALLPGPKPLKLRSSCDSCGIAKVKCDRGQPDCSRCAALGLTCVYGPSRKFGKPPRKRPCTGLDATTSVSYGKRTARIAETGNNHTAVGFRQHQSVNEPAHLKFSDLVTDILPLSPGMNSTLSFYEPDQLSSGFFAPMSLDGWPQFDGLGAGLEIPSDPKSSAPEGLLSASALEPVSTVRMTSNSHESHSCPRESYEILRDLICPGPYLHAPEANSVTVSAQLDEVLHFNRDAINRLSRLLKCPCAKSGHRVMVHASIVSRILIWYQQAVGWTGSSAWGAPPSALTDSPSSCGVSSPSLPPSGTAAGTGTTSPRTLAQSTGFIVEHVPVSMGTFSIEDQNVQAAFRIQLVLSELKKTANLIDFFTSQDSGESSVNGVAGLYLHLGAWLRNEHSRTARILRSRLSALKENLDS